MLQIRHQAFNLQFEYPFTISKGTKTHQPTLIVGLGLGQVWGWGEATAISYYGVTVQSMVEQLVEKQAAISRYALTDPQRFWHFLEHLMPGENFLIAALDMAGWDLFARMRRMPLYRLLRLDPGRAPFTDYTIGMDTTDGMIAKIQAHPWPAYKIKIGSADDIDIIRKLRQATDKPFRIDANEALQPDDAKRLLPELQQLGVELLEQPLKRDAWDAMKELKQQSPIPLFADESCVGEKDVARCAEAFHGINIKLTKCGGITPAMRMIGEAKKLGLKLMMGSMNESTIGTAAVVQLAPLLDYMDADGPLLLKEDVGDGLIYNNGAIGIAEAPGLGTRFWGAQRMK
jgi:L-alanine-DL-glutamate epimerase-like enolase superfamily enzyme